MLSCKKATLENSVPNPERFTTVEMQKLQKDTVIIAVDGIDVYIFENNIVKTQLKIMNNNSIVMTLGDIILIIVIIIIFVYSPILFMEF